MRGTAIAVFLMCFAAVMGFMAISGVSQTIGFSPDSGLQDNNRQVQEDLGGEQRPSDRGGGGGLLGFAVFAGDQLANFFSLFGSVQAVLITLGFPPYLAGQVQGIVVVIGTLMLIWILRGVIPP